MKLNLLAVVAGTLSLSLSACGADLDGLINQGDAAAQEAEETAAYLLADDDTAEMSDEADEAVLEQENGQEKSEQRELIKQIHHTLRAEVAECAGISNEANALWSKRKELRDSGVSRKDAKEQLSAEREALKAVSKENRDVIKQCKESAKGSEAGILLKDFVTSCWEKPEKPAKPEFGGQKERKGKKGKKGPMGGKRHKGKKLGSPNFESEACIGAQEAVNAFLASSTEE